MWGEMHGSHGGENETEEDCSSRVSLTGEGGGRRDLHILICSYGKKMEGRTQEES